MVTAADNCSICYTKGEAMVLLNQFSTFFITLRRYVISTFNQSSARLLVGKMWSKDFRPIKQIEHLQWVLTYLLATEYILLKNLTIEMKD